MKNNQEEDFLRRMPSEPLELVKKLARLILSACAILGTSIAFAAPQSQAGCPSINTLGNRLVDNEIVASIVFSNPNGTGFNQTATYMVTTPNKSAVAGVPGLIQYCVYPKQPPGQPDTITRLYDSWTAGPAPNPAVQGYFSYARPNGNPTNLPFDGTTQTVGSADWTTPANGAPLATDQTIVLHINDPEKCNALYGGDPGTCFVLPGNNPPPPPGFCPGNTPACKEVLILDAQGNVIDPNAVPVKTALFLSYTYVIANPLAEAMLFYQPTAKTQDINAGGGKDYFGCEQIPDPTGVPGTFGAISHFLLAPNGGAFKLDFKSGSGACNQSRFFLTVDSGVAPVSLTPGQSMTFGIDMTLRKNKGGQQEYTSCGIHILNSGFTVKWFVPSSPLLQSYSTHDTPLTVNVVGCST